MTPILKRLLVNGIEVPLDPNEEMVARLSEVADSMEMAESFANFSNSSASVFTTAAELQLSAPLSAQAARFMDSIVRTPVRGNPLYADDVENF